MSSQNDLRLIHGIVERLHHAPPARFSYTEEALENDEIEGVQKFDKNAAQNIPLDTETDYDSYIHDKGIRAQGASYPRQAHNHFLGRFSYNLRKLTEKFMEFLGVFSSALAHNAAEYDSNARYRTGDVCYTVGAARHVKVYTWHVRVSASPEAIQGIHPEVALHWAAMQESTS